MTRVGRLTLSALIGAFVLAVILLDIVTAALSDSVLNTTAFWVVFLGGNGLLVALCLYYTVFWDPVRYMQRRKAREQKR